jgi:hypothetical protein
VDRVAGAQEINGRINVQHEILGFNEGATIFAPKVKRFLEQHYAGCAFRCVGDPKGRDKGQATEQSAYGVSTPSTRGAMVRVRPTGPPRATAGRLVHASSLIRCCGDLWKCG